MLPCTPITLNPILLNPLLLHPVHHPPPIPHSEPVPGIGFSPYPYPMANLFHLYPPPMHFVFSPYTYPMANAAMRPQYSQPHFTPTPVTHPSPYPYPMANAFYPYSPPMQFRSLPYPYPMANVAMQPYYPPPPTPPSILYHTTLA